MAELISPESLTRLHFDKPPCVVLVSPKEGAPTSLQAIRCLGREGIPVIAAGANAFTPSYYSRYTTYFVQVPDQKKSPVLFIYALIKLAQSLDQKAALQCCNDYDVTLINENRELLKGHYYAPYVADDTLDAVINKEAMFAAAEETGFDLPATFFVKNQSDAEKALDCPFPAIVKPFTTFRCSANGNSFQSVYDKKGIRTKNHGELRAVLDKAVACNVEVIVQEEIPGPVERLLSYGSYSDAAGKVTAGFFAKKIRQFPPDCGSGCLTEPAPPTPVLAEIAKTFIEKTRYHGIAEFEWKYDERDCKFKFMEINPRCWTWSCLAARCGVNFPLIQYGDVTGQKVDPQWPVEPEVKWVDAASEYLLFRYHRQSVPLSAWEVISSWKKPREFAFGPDDDRLPGVIALIHNLCDYSKRGYQKLLGLLKIRPQSEYTQ